MELSISLLQWAAAILVIVAASLVQGSIGFGVALVAAPLLYLIDPVFVPAPMMVVGLAVSLLVYWRERRAVDLPEIGRVLPGIVLGTVAAAAVLRVVSEDALGLLFGGLVLLGVLLSIHWRPPEPGSRLLFAAGGLSGFMGTTTSIGGPPLVLLFQNRAGTHLRGTLSACFVPAGVLALIALYWSGHLGMSEAVVGVSLLPAVALGFWLSGWTAGLLDRQWLRGALLAVSAAAAIGAIVRAVL